MELNKILQGDCLEVLKTLPENSVDSIVTDPPYELGFMGKSWDSTGIANNKEMWAECLRVLKPGGHLLAFSGTRTYHRMASAIEDAGFEVRDMIEWVYGSGFPKSLNIGKEVDKRGGTTADQSREFAEYIKKRRNELNITLSKADDVVCGGTTNYSWFEGRLAGQRLPRKADYLKIKELLKLDDRYDNFMEETERELIATKDSLALPINDQLKGWGEKKQFKITKGTSEWEGWGTALKPAHEPICMARKPLAEPTVAQNCLKYGTGGINIDESRVETTEETRRAKCGWQDNGYVGGEYDNKKYDAFKERENNGRFPANLIHDNSEEVRECFPETKSGGGLTKRKNKDALFDFGQGYEREEISDSGSASRFFKSIPIEEVKNCSVVINCSVCGKPKKIRASIKKERNYCSLECSHKGKTLFNSQNVECDYCGTEFTKKNSQMFTDKHFCSRECFGEWQSKFLLGENSYNWKDGKMDLISRVRSLKKMIDWRNEVYKRDNYTCQKCGDNTGGNLEAHHKKHLSDLIRELNLVDITDAIESKELWDIDNGITLCDDCHIETHKTESKKSVLYFAKASKSERNRGCDGLEEGEVIRQGLAGEHNNPTHKNNHPTVKPIALMEYLIKMVTKPGGIVLDPFAGSGSTLVAAKQNGYQYIGIELTEEYIPIIEARLKSSPNPLF